MINTIKRMKQSILKKAVTANLDSRVTERQLMKEQIINHRIKMTAWDMKAKRA